MIVLAESILQLRGFDQNASSAGVLLRSGDSIVLEREPTNRYDANAVTAKTLDGDLIGRVAREYTESVSAILKKILHLGIRHRSVLLGTSTKIIVCHDGSTYESTRVTLRVEYLVVSVPSDLQIRGLAEAADGGNVGVVFIMD